MKLRLAIPRLFLLSVCVLFSTSCNKEENSTLVDQSPKLKTPTSVVRYLLDEIAKSRADKKSGETTTSQPDRSMTMSEIFAKPEKAKFIMMAFVMIRSDNVEYLSEKINGDKAEVELEYLVTGFGTKVKFEKSAYTKTQVIVQLEKINGQWKISDTGGILAEYGK